MLNPKVATQCEVIFACDYAMLFADDVIGLAAVKCILFRNQEVLANALSPRYDQAAQVGGDVSHRHGAYPCCMRCLARALARRITCSICKYWFSSAVSSGDKESVFWR